MTGVPLGRAMEAEIAEQRPLLSSRADSLFRAVEAIGPPPQLVVFAARGSSDNAALYGRYLVECRLGVPVSLAAPSVITRYKSELRYTDALVVGISQSASAPDVAEVLLHARRAGQRTLSITNAPAGPVVDAADLNVLLGAGEERAVAATKTFTLTLLALYQLVRALGGKLRRPDLTDVVREALDDERPEQIASQLAAISGLVFTLGRGFQYAVAEEAALKLMECALVAAKPFSSADFAHGPIAMAEQGSCALLFGDDEGDPTALGVRDKLRQSGATLFELTAARGIAEELRPVVTAILAQRVALSLARKRGLDPDRPRNLSKVTRTL